MTKCGNTFWNVLNRWYFWKIVKNQAWVWGQIWRYLFVRVDLGNTMQVSNFEYLAWFLSERPVFIRVLFRISVNMVLTENLLENRMIQMVNSSWSKWKKCWNLSEFTDNSCQVKTNVYYIVFPYIWFRQKFQ